MSLPELIVRPMRPGESEHCEQILRSIPDWFGIEESLLEYARQTEATPTFIAELNGSAIGFASVKQHLPRIAPDAPTGAAELAVIAVRAGHHRAGAGRALLQQAEIWALSRRCTLLYVKTMGPSRPNPEYAATLRFYLAMGFVPLEELHREWGGMPCLILCKVM